MAPQDIPLTSVCALQDNPLCMDRLHRWLHRASPPRGEHNFSRFAVSYVSLIQSFNAMTWNTCEILYCSHTGPYCRIWWPGAECIVTC
jgi:hypothetical protein